MELGTARKNKMKNLCSPLKGSWDPLAIEECSQILQAIEPR